MTPRKPTFWINIFFSTILIELLAIPRIITDGSMYGLMTGLFSVSMTVCLLIWAIVYGKIRGDVTKKEIAQLPVLTSYATLVEKIKEDHRNSSAYFLSFELDDRSRKLFKVQRDTYAGFTENEKGLLTYKQDSGYGISCK